MTITGQYVQRKSYFFCWSSLLAFLRAKVLVSAVETELKLQKGKRKSGRLSPQSKILDELGRQRDEHDFFAPNLAKARDAHFPYFVSNLQGRLGPDDN